MSAKKERALRLISLILCTLLLSPAFASLASGEARRNVFYSHPNDSSKIALTFDDGPHPRYTRQILDILDEYGIKATFFVVGENAKYYSDVLCDVVDRGHEIGNHTYLHGSIAEKNFRDMRAEIDRCQQTIEDICGQTPRLFRPPGGELSREQGEQIEGLSYKVILWNLDTRDWAHNSPDKICNYLLSNVKSGDIILMHDYIAKNSPTPEALRRFIPEMLDAGYRFVTVSELLTLGE